MADIRNILLVTLTLVLQTVFGAPDTSISCCSCDSLFPDAPQGTAPQIMPSPFVLKVDKRAYFPENYAAEEINVNISTRQPTTGFTQFILQAVSIDRNGNVEKEPSLLGRFTNLDPRNFSTVYDCGGDKAIKSADNSKKTHMRFTWEPLAGQKGNFKFRATFIIDANHYWVRELSDAIIDPDAPPLYKKPSDPNLLPLIDVIDTSDCGSSKGCYRVPEGCWEPYCDYIATWQHLGGNSYKFELGAQTHGMGDRHVSLAISEDIRWGNDRVFECVHDSNTGVTRVYQAISEGHDTKLLPNPTEGIVRPEGQFWRGRIRCRFEVYPTPGMEGYPMDGYNHLLMSRGNTFDGKTAPHKYGPGEIPVATPEKVSLTTAANIHGFARFPLAKAHGCLIIIAFIFFCTIGLLWTKYYRTMWPNKRFFGLRYWVVAHFNCMLWVLLLVVIAVICIFIEVGGYSKAWYLPYKAHPILGIIILVCVIIYPILFFIRPGEDHQILLCIINWFLWLFLTVAWCLAIPNMFIGMDWGKSMVPWWATWILFIYILFHIIVEITLEVHQCCTHKKNKERRKKYEFQIRENPKAHIPEPEPAGRVFKKNMLLAHFIVTCIVTLIMVLAIATG